MARLRLSLICQYNVVRHFPCYLQECVFVLGHSLNNFFRLLSFITPRIPPKGWHGSSQSVLWDYQIFPTIHTVCLQSELQCLFYSFMAMDGPHANVTIQNFPWAFWSMLEYVYSTCELQSQAMNLGGNKDWEIRAAKGWRPRTLCPTR